MNDFYLKGVIKMDEFAFINTITPNAYRQSALLKGIGDDAAVFRQTTKDIATAVDTFVEDVHFTKQTMSMYHVGYKCLAVNISDLAAMGARPVFYLVSIVVPHKSTEEEVLEVYRGMSDIASIFNMDLIGGDTVSGNDWMITITVIGFVLSNKVRYRHHAKDNDFVFVTGTLGDAQAGLQILLHSLSVEKSDYFIERHRMPTPRVDFSLQSMPIKRMALNDISDGLASELNELAESSDVAIIIDDAKIPVHPYFSQFKKEDQYNWKLFGGEDFELVGTVAPTEWEKLQEIAKSLQLPITKIGYVVSDEKINGNVYIEKDKQTERLKPKGYRHKIGGENNEKR